MSVSPAAPLGSLPINLLREPLLRRLSGVLDRAAPGRGWRDLAQRAGSHGRVKLSSLELEQCSLKVLEPEGSPSWSLLRLMGERGCTVVELMEFLQALEHTEALQCLNPPGIKIVVQPDPKSVLSGQMVKLCCWATGHPFLHYQWFKQKKEVITQLGNLKDWMAILGKSQSVEYKSLQKTGVHLPSSLSWLKDIFKNTYGESFQIGNPKEQNPQYSSHRSSTAQVPHGNSPELIFNPVSVNDSGFYICRVNSDSSFVFSQWVQLDVCDLQGVSYGSLVGLPENKIQICIQPQSQNLMVGDTLVLECGAVGNPVPHYQWFRNGFPLTNGNRKVYKVTYVDMEHQGTYWCRVFNDQDNQETKKIEVMIGFSLNIQGRKAMTVECNEEKFSSLGKPDLQEQSADRPSAIDKVALLIGNMSYWNHPQLKAPMVDVYELTNLLRQLDFKVVSLLDLTESEMRNAVDEFLLLLDKGVYGLLYYAGHGYENYGNSFMVPIDAPNPYRSANCLCVQNILKLMQEKETGLNVFLLDMCRKRNEYDDTILILDALKVTANIVFGYATCQGAEAFEIQHSGLANGIFMKFLKERMLEDKKITVLLDKVAEDMGKCHLTKGKQALEIRSSLSEKRALTDPIEQTGSSPESLARNLQWAKAHELPESMYLDFKCGVQIQLGFAAEFSNVMIIYTRIVKKPPEILVCNAYVTDFPLDLDIDPKEANKGTPEETGSYLVSKDLPKHCLYTRLSSLQKLKEHLIFTVCLHYEYPGIDDSLDERKDVNVGKPLIAKLGIHHGFKKNCCMSNRPFHTQAPIPVAAEYYLSPNHSQPNSYPSVHHPNSAHSDHFRQQEPCHCNVTLNVLTSRQEAWTYSPHIRKNNIPVETTDDTVDLGFSFSSSPRVSKKQ